MHILPQPKKIERLKGSFAIDGNCTIYTDDCFVDEAQRFAALVEGCCGFRPQLVPDIQFAHVIFKREDTHAAEQYSVQISDGVATVTCATATACFYAVETLRQLLSLDIPQSAPECENCYIEDQPKFAYRGLMLDVCRHFFGADTVKTIIDLMARLKLNKLHLHLSDDQGFRMEIKRYPLLTEVGANRSGSEVVKGGKRYVDDTPHGGFYTQDELRDIVAYAAAHKIDVIPEIDLPGHAMAMIAAYPELSCSGKPAEVRTKWGISKDILCAGNDHVYDFVKGVLDEVCDVFPSQYIHLGGDEAPKERWCNCKLCKARMSELKLGSFEQLQTYMVNEFRAYLEQKGRKVICWNDGLDDSANADIVSQVWAPGTTAQGVRRANRGRKTIMSPFFRMYFDYPYAMTPLHKTLAFNPLAGVKSSAKDNILGVEGTVWTEYIADADKLFFNLLPRLDALAECAWGYHSRKFSKYLREKFAVYGNMGVMFNSGAISKQFILSRLDTLRKFRKVDADIELTRYKGMLGTKLN